MCQPTHLSNFKACMFNPMPVSSFKFHHHPKYKLLEKQFLFHQKCLLFIIKLISKDNQEINDSRIHWKENILRDSYFMTLLAIAPWRKKENLIWQNWETKKYIIASIWSNQNASKKIIQYKNVRFNYLQKFNLHTL